jgi:serine phosphatase RsbU (regulator of sigma subunit)
VNDTGALSELSEAVARQETVDSILARVADAAATLIPDCDAASVTVIEGDRPTTAAATEASAIGIDRVQYDAGSGPCLEAVRTGKPVHWHPGESEWPAVAEACRREGMAAVLSVPLAYGEAVLGALNLYSRSPRGFAQELESASAAVLAEQVTVAVATTRALEEQRTIAVALQRNLLPRALPEVPGYEFAACYQPASATARVGGDWYDAYRLGPAGPVAVVIGDVEGHSIDAASMMAVLRTGVRAFTLEGHGPAAALDLTGRLRALSDPGPDALFATVTLLLVDPETGSGHLASAGHLPPAIRRAGGHVEFVAGAGGLPLGVDETARCGEEFLTLEPGSSLVLFTDGLVEARTEPIDDGLARLAELLAADPVPAGALCDHVISSMQPPGGYEDDVALLVVRRR